jgi:hypothetical protein
MPAHELDGPTYPHAIMGIREIVEALPVGTENSLPA